MKPTNTPQVKRILEKAYTGRKVKHVQRNYWLTEEQDAMLAAMAEYNGESKVSILRSIIDDWRRMQLTSGE